MLLDELLGFSNKRLRKIFRGEKITDSSSSDTDEDVKPDLEVISLDEISDDDNLDICAVEGNYFFFNLLYVVKYFT